MYESCEVIKSIPFSTVFKKRYLNFFFDEIRPLRACIIHDKQRMEWCVNFIKLRRCTYFAAFELEWWIDDELLSQNLNISLSDRVIEHPKSRSDQAILLDYRAKVCE